MHVQYSCTVCMHVPYPYMYSMRLQYACTYHMHVQYACSGLYHMPVGVVACRQRLQAMRELNDLEWNRSNSPPGEARPESPRMRLTAKDPFYDRYPWIRLIGRLAQQREALCVKRQPALFT